MAKYRTPKYTLSWRTRDFACGGPLVAMLEESASHQDQESDSDNFRFCIKSTSASNIATVILWPQKIQIFFIFL